MPLRRQTVGLVPCFDMLLLGMDLGDEVLERGSLREVVEIAVDSVVLENVCLSLYLMKSCVDLVVGYMLVNIEQARGNDTHNTTTVTMLSLSLRLPLQESMNYVGSQNSALLRSFLFAQKSIPYDEFPLDARDGVREYVWGIGNWITAHVEWRFESERYFGKGGGEVRESKMVTLLPRKQEIRDGIFDFVFSVGRRQFDHVFLYRANSEFLSAYFVIHDLPRRRGSRWRSRKHAFLSFGCAGRSESGMPNIDMMQRGQSRLSVKKSPVLTSIFHLLPRPRFWQSFTSTHQRRRPFHRTNQHITTACLR